MENGERLGFVSTTDALLWDKEKDEKLKRERNISFDDVRHSLGSGGFLADVEHPNLARFPNQRLMVVQIRGETYVVPYVPGDKCRFLKTIYPSRKARRQHGRPKSATDQAG